MNSLAIPSIEKDTFDALPVADIDKFATTTNRRHQLEYGQSILILINVDCLVTLEFAV